MSDPTGKLPVRMVMATSLFDGHDAAINVMRRIVQREGAEVIHLGHNRSVREIVDAAIQEDVHGIAVSSYQGGHLEFFKYMIDLLRERDAGHIRVFAGGGGTIVAAESAELEAYGVARIYSPQDGRTMGLEGMVGHMLAQCDAAPPEIDWIAELERIPSRDPQALARCLTFVELRQAGAVNEEAAQFFFSRLEEAQDPARPAGDGAGGGAVSTRAESGAGGGPQGRRPVPVLGITGTGGAGKSSLTDELIRRFLEEFPDKTVAVLSIDPTHRRRGGALLGDRIRMNAIDTPRVYMRSLATRGDNGTLPAGIERAVAVCRAARFDLVVVETAGIGQGDTQISDVADFTVYVMTPEFGAASQLEKIGMLDYADMIAINKFDKRGSQDALREVKKQVRRNRGDFGKPDGEIPVYGTVASLFQDPATTAFYHALIGAMESALGLDWRRQGAQIAAGAGALQPPVAEPGRAGPPAILPPERERYLSEIAGTVRDYRAGAEEAAALASRAYTLHGALGALGEKVPDGPEPLDGQSLGSDAARVLADEYNRALDGLAAEALEALAGYDALGEAYREEQFRYTVRDVERSAPNFDETLAGLRVPKVVLPRLRDWGDRLRWLLLENAPGRFPFTGGVFPFKRPEEEPTRMFAGEGTPERTNRRFHFIAAGQPAQRLSTAFDSVTLYGEDPHQRPDIYGKVGNSGVSICTLDDTKRLYSGFDLAQPNTSVSMTINGPAPMALAFFLNTAIDQQVEKHLKNEGRWEQAQTTAGQFFSAQGVAAPRYREPLPPGNDGLGLGLLGLGGERVVPPETYAKIKADTLRTVRGTIQADILKEDQAQNTCIFSTDFALTMMGDIEAYFVEHDMANFYSVSVSGYHMAEAGANPITQVAFTLANGFTFVEHYLSRGLPIDKFARNLSFFFSNGMEAEYAVIGRVARRIWAVALREKYHAGERAQKLKYHIQTSGRSLHAQEIGFNDIRTTLQALYAVYDNCNSLHTNAYDEAITTPTEESVRRAIAIQLIVNREL
ncbi:MAG: methylmalonyl-CoA mutase family protein, partial [bacterium]